MKRFAGLILAVFLCAHASAAEIPQPAIPDVNFNITDFGAVGDGKTMNTDSIAKAIAACAAAGGGKVIVPVGSFLTGPFTLTSNLDFHLDKGATILISDNLADFKVVNHRVENCIQADNCHDIRISGDGVIDGQGANWWKTFLAAKNSPIQPDHRPFLVVMNNCQRVDVEGITLTNSPMFHLVPQGCRDVMIDGITIRAPADAPNTDGIDPSGYNFHITRCTIDVGDDNIALKPSRRIDPDQPSCQHFQIDHCAFLHGHGMSIGNPTPGGLRDLMCEDCSFENTDTAIRMKTSRAAGGIVEDCTYQNITMHDVKTAILITDYYPRIPANVEDDPAQPVGPATPIFRNILIRNVTADGVGVAGQILGVAEMPVSDVTLENVKIQSNTGLRLVHVKPIKFLNCQITPTTGPAETFSDSQVVGTPL